MPDRLSGAARRLGSYLLVDDALDLHGLHDVSDELRVCVGVSDLVVQQRSDGALNTLIDFLKKKADGGDRTQRIPHCQFSEKKPKTDLELGADGLRLEADIKKGNVAWNRACVSACVCVCVRRRASPPCDRLTSSVGLEGSGQHPDECGFPRACRHTSGGMRQRGSLRRRLSGSAQTHRSLPASPQSRSR